MHAPNSLSRHTLCVDDVAVVHSTSNTRVARRVDTRLLNFVHVSFTDPIGGGGRQHHGAVRDGKSVI